MKSKVIFLLVLTASFVWGDDHKLSPELKGRHSKNSIDVIVQFRTAPTLHHENRVSRHGALVKQQLGSVKGLLVSVAPSRLAELSNEPDVAYVSPDRPISKQMNNAAVGVLANYAWSLGYDGTGIAVAVIDSGVHGVDDLKDAPGHNRILYNYDSLGGGADDQYGHGTHVAGIIGGSGKDSVCSNCDVTIRGIAPNVNIVNFDPVGQQVQGTEDPVINSITNAIQCTARD